jgi:hypothetical protein
VLPSIDEKVFRGAWRARPLQPQSRKNGTSNE